MRERSINVQIPKPYHEKWDDMTPQDKGRHCASCEKVVTDFTQMSDREVIDFLRKDKGSGCGRLNPRQLSAPVTTVEKNKSWSSPIGIALSTALSILISNQTAAQKISEKIYVQEQSVTGGYDVLQNSEPSALESREFKGQITDSETGAPIPFVNIVFDKSGLGGSTDFDGFFSIPRGIEEIKHLEVTITSLGYVSERFCPADPDSFQNIQLTPLYFNSIEGVRGNHYVTTGIMVGDIVIVESKPKRFLRKVGRVVSWPYHRTRSAIRDW